MDWMVILDLDVWFFGSGHRRFADTKMQKKKGGGKFFRLRGGLARRKKGIPDEQIKLQGGEASGG
jgi:hypothetical protein